MKKYYDEDHKGLLAFSIIIFVLSVLILLGFTALSRDWSKDSFIISSDLVAVSYLFFGWFFYISEKDLMDSVTHGFKSFFRRVTKKTKVSYVEYLDNKRYAPAYVYYVLFGVSVLYFGLSILLRVI